MGLKSKKQECLFCLAIALLLLLAYSNSFKSSFQHDDIHGIVSNPHTKDPGNLPRFFVDPKTGSGIYGEISSGYRPLLVASFALNYLVGGLNVFGYHLVNFLLHLLCTFLVYFILLHFFRQTGAVAEAPSLRSHLPAFFAALVFGLHPVQTESVTYISGRSSALTALFWLASFLAYLQYHCSGKTERLFLSALSYACALLSKETAITLLPVLLVFILMFPRKEGIRRRWFPVLGHVLMTFLYLGARVYFFRSLQYGSEPVRPFFDNLFSQSRAWIHYVGTLLLPLNLNFDYDFPVSRSLLDPRVILSISLLSALGIAIWRMYRSNRAVGFFALWVAINLLPTNSLIAIEDLVSDRWLYLSCAGYAALLVIALGWCFQTRVETGGRAAKIVFFFLCAVIIEFYGYSTLLRNFDWRTQRTLWEDAAAKSPGKARPYNGLGVGLIIEGRLEEAKEAFQKAISLEPRGGQPYLNLGNIYSLQGDWDRAIEYYQRAIPLSPKLLSDIHSRMGLTYLRRGNMADSEKHLRRAIEIRPHNAAPHYFLGLYFEKNGEMEQAISCLEKAKKLDPDSLLVQEALGRVYRTIGSGERVGKSKWVGRASG